jgi:hypothetical protein
MGFVVVAGLLQYFLFLFRCFRFFDFFDFMKID